MRDSKSLESCVTLIFRVKRNHDNNGILEYFLPTGKDIQNRRHQIFLLALQRALAKNVNKVWPTVPADRITVILNGKEQQEIFYFFLVIYKQTLERS